MTRILVCGGRNYHNLETVFMFLDGLANNQIPEPISCIITGMAQGADSIALTYAYKRNIHAEKFPAFWKRDGRKAGPIRNQQMIDEGKPDYVVAFPGGIGTLDMITRAKIHNIKVIEVKK